jgi:hypothetical protein
MWYYVLGGFMEALDLTYKLKEKDEDDSYVSVDNIVIKKVSNGWLVATTFDDDTEVTEVFDLGEKDNGNLQAIKCIIASMGLENEIKIK